MLDKNKQDILALFKKYRIIERFEKMSPLSAFVAGSIYEGFGNRRSDLDVFLVVDYFDFSILEQFVLDNNKFSLYKAGKKVILTVTENEKDFDIELHLKDNISFYCKRINDLKMSPENIYYDFFHRLKFAEPVFGEDWFYDLKETLNYQHFNLLSPLTYQMQYGLKVTDILGEFEQENFITSYRNAMLLLEDCINSFLSLHGETNPKKKWLIKKIQRFSLQNPESEFDLLKILDSSYQNVNLFDDLGLKAKTLDIMRQCQKLNYACEKLVSEVQ
ncbi:hypothetical protein [Streptococcus sp. 2106]|uniref:hypothetical protein n=1 Tax=Streptococcus sp. 2106 TaxID=2582642 RepID=UPI0015624926|nr:hypothetical protein [Streptococcus sp. 2106]